MSLSFFLNFDFYYFFNLLIYIFSLFLNKLTFDSLRKQMGRVTS